MLMVSNLVGMFSHNKFAKSLLCFLNCQVYWLSFFMGAITFISQLKTMTNNYWIPNISQKGFSKKGLSDHLSTHCPVHFSAPHPPVHTFSWNFIIMFFLNFGLVLEVVHEKGTFFWKKLCPQNGENGPKIGFFNLLKNLIIFSGFV